jgi:hypothetical protein
VLDSSDAKFFVSALRVGFFDMIRKLSRSILSIVLGVFLSLLATEVSAQSLKNYSVRVLAPTGPPILISPLMYGINYVWDVIPENLFAAFGSLSLSTGVILARFPGGWDGEVYNWQTNRLTAPPHGQPIPANPGAAPWQVTETFPAVSFVLKSHPAVINSSQIPSVVAGDIAVVGLHNEVPIWEIGNEWWNQSGNKVNRNGRLLNYSALVAQLAPKIKAIAPTAEIYVTGDWTNIAEFDTMRAAVGSTAWSAVDGISVHVYCTADGSASDCSNIPAAFAAVKTSTGKDLIYVSEWSVTGTPTGSDVGIWDANQAILTFNSMILSGATGASYWSPVAQLEPDHPIMMTTCTQLDAVGSLFDFVRPYDVGQVFQTTGDIPAAAAQQVTSDGRTITTIFIPTDTIGHSVVWLHDGLFAKPPDPSTVHVTVSALYAPDISKPQTTAISTLPWRTGWSNGDHWVEVEVNPGTSGRGSAAEILRVSIERPSN